MQASQKTVLLVEDEPLILMDVADTLSEAGFQVIEARSADRAAAMLMTGLAFDILVTDVDMPGTLNGLALAAFVAVSRPDVDIVVTSGRDVSHLIPSVATFVPKPARPDRLLCAVSGNLPIAA
ncbi:response regulator [Rhizobium sp. BK176]|uniref:response regulator n=1 Tax=Rhizobium sp. BK176 TaxID=2587071 RepID=UPI0021691F19|nr:response regulator [Rhizobium sp. BK176]MCS4088864.1 DNA-binding NtrC family response regulator [Rhizobium sp. BK176]